MFFSAGGTSFVLDAWHLNVLFMADLLICCTSNLFTVTCLPIDIPSPIWNNCVPLNHVTVGSGRPMKPKKPEYLLIVIVIMGLKLFSALLYCSELLCYVLAAVLLNLLYNLTLLYILCTDCFWWQSGTRENIYPYINLDILIIMTDTAPHAFSKYLKNLLLFCYRVKVGQWEFW